MKLQQLLLLLFFQIFLLIGAEKSFAQETTGTAVAVTVVSPIVDARNKLDDEEKSVAQIGEKADVRKRDLLKQNLEALEAAQKFTSQSLVYKRNVDSAPNDLKALRNKLSKTTKSVTPDVSGLDNYLEIGLIVDQAKTTVSLYQKNLDGLREETERRSKRLQEIPKQIAELNQQVANLSKSTVGNAEDSPELSDLRKIVAENRNRALTNNRLLLQDEIRFYEVDARLQSIREDIASRLLTDANSIYESLRRAYERRQQLERNQAIQNAQHIVEMADLSDPLILRLANDVTTAIAERKDVNSIYNKNVRLSQDLDKLKGALSELSDKYENLKSNVQKMEASVNTVSLSESIGSMLRQQLKGLPSTREHLINLESLKAELAVAELRLLNLRDQKSNFRNIDALVDKTLRSNTQTSVISKEQQTLEVRQILSAHAALIDNSISEYENYFDTLQQSAFTEESLISKITDFRSFIDERILWIPSTQPLKIEDLQELPIPLLRFFNKESLLTIWNDLKSDSFSKPMLYSFVGFGYLCLFYFHTRLRNELRTILDNAAASRLSAFKPILESITIVVFLTLLVPLALGFFGWRLSVLPRASNWNLSIGIALKHTAVGLFFLLIIQRLSRNKGVFETFFEWPENILKRLRRILYLLMWVWVPGTFIIAYCESYASGLADEICSRVVLIFTLLVGAVFSYLLWNSKNGILYHVIAKDQGSWLYYFRFPILIFSISVPLALALGSGLGYHYTVMQLAQRISATVWLAVLLLIMNEVIFFWILVKRRRLALEEAKKRREAQRIAQLADSEPTDANDLLNIPEPTLDISAISLQAGRILKIIIILIFIMLTIVIWTDVFPALRILDRPEFQLWDVQSKVSTVITADDGTKSIKVTDTLVPVTVLDVFRALIILVLMFVAMRNIPGLMEITVLQRFAIGAGEKYALKSIVSYIIIVLGIIAAANILGLQWSSIQWLAAAVSVGLGFGLQDIFSNFVSGLILLFERPVRVGDIVTVGPVTGRVSQIRIRATTIVNWDYKEHILPNKALITGEVLNWTLSNRMIRLAVPVPVKDGQDMNQIQALLVEVASRLSNVMADPKPVAELIKFGEFALYIFLPSPDNIGDVRHDLLEAIDKSFREHGIEKA